ncbi:hypothetical protein LTS08_001923 [Lithohypha guttulata]|uniref:uncharacterized protein n=1 Tax=Lithohypha guttulata TaxID=1690604 RepID=UPI002DDFBCC4|nr:hypothetical protein LTR51_004564 [Lithohypha guttulata]KAK5104039.1 hypothetical protein LTS08_001923 [Lithohypha guttulata]
MGLHFYRNPDEDEVNSAAAKLDRAAAWRRSGIRRDPVARPRDQSPTAGLTNIIRSRHEMRQARLRAHREFPETDSQIEILEAEIERLRRERERTIARQNEQTRDRLVRHIENTLNLASAGSPSSHGGIYLPPLTDETVEEQASSEAISLPRPARESNLRFELDTTSAAIPISPRQQANFIPSPPLSLSDASRRRPVDGPLETWETTPSLTRDFAPARVARATLRGREDSTAATTTTRQTEDDGAPGLETPPPESWEGSYPPLRRVPHMSPRPLPRTTLDGLGDRRRSPSPLLSETPEEATWNHLLTTMDNSTRTNTASASTSFTSTVSTTALSTLERQIQSASTSFGEIGSSSDDTCDLPPGITEDDVRRIRDRHRRSARRLPNTSRRYIAESDHHDRFLESLVDSNTDTAIGMSSLRGEPSLATLIQEERARNRRQRRQDELTMLQAIANRQQNHETIPDDWWSLAGLPASLARAHNDI